MAVAAQNTNNTTIMSILLAKKLTGLNFTNWYHNLRIVLCMGKVLAELHAMLKLHEKGIPKKAETPAVLTIGEGKIQKDKKKRQGANGKNKEKNKLAYAPKAKILPPPKRDMHNLYPNVSCYVYNVSNKRAKHALDSDYLWYCRLGHINKKRMDMLQCDGLLQPTHDESHEKCKSCISKKMAREPFPRQVEGAKDLLGLIHTDVFQNEVANQLDKKIKAIRSERGEEYLSHEFVNHMKSCGIVSQLTPPYTLQHNGVFERRNQNLLDMVQSMINLTTLPKYFWGYALETAARILNMVPTKNLDRTPYKIWHEKAPKSTRIPQVPNKYGYYVDIKEYELRDLDEPSNYKAALADPESDKWLEGMNTEMQSMRDNQVWYLVDLSSNGQTVGCKWLFKKKNDMDGNSYKDSLTIVAFYDYEIWQMDVKTVFLNGHLSEDQASRSWNKRFDEEIKKIGFTQTPDEPCVYLKTSGSNVAFIVLYADDILLMGNSITMLQEVKSWLCKCFSMKDLGEAACIFRINIIRDRSKRLIALSQSAYLEKILKKFRMENSKKKYTSMMENLTIESRKQNYGEIHRTVVKTILKYLKNTKDMVLVYGAKPEDEMKVSCYADASFQTDKDDTKSQTRHMFVLNASMEAIWMGKFIDGLKDVMPSNKRLIEMLCDNERALAIASDPKILKGAKHFQRKYHYIREVIQEREIVLKKVHIDDNIADPFTKPMPFNKHFKHAMAIAIVPPSSLM
nr:hypothetical protein [Tanacetum cinerariifolium]